MYPLWGRRWALQVLSILVLVGLVLSYSLLPYSPKASAVPISPNQNSAPSDRFTSAVIDTANGFAYFGTCSGAWPHSTSSSATIVKVRLSDFTQVAALTLSPSPSVLYEDEWDCLSSGVIDTDHGYAYFGTMTIPGVIVKIRLSDFTTVAYMTLNDYEAFATSAVIDTINGYAYFGIGTIYNSTSDTYYSAIAKIRLSDFTRVATLSLIYERSPYSAVIDTVNGYAYFGTDVDIVKVRLSDFTLAGVVQSLNEYEFASAVIDVAGGFAYFGTWTGWHNDTGTYSDIVKVRLSDFTRVETLILDPSEQTLQSAVIDTANGYAYFVASTSPGVIAKVAISPYTNFAQTDSLILPNNTGTGCGGCAGAAVIDTAKGYAYIGTPGTIVKVSLSDFSVAGTLTPKLASIEVTKSCSPVTQAPPGPLTWTIMVANDGKTALAVTVIDSDTSRPNPAFEGTLAPGQNQTISIADTNLQAGNYTNTVTATGLDASGTEFRAMTSDTCEVTTFGHIIIEVPNTSPGEYFDFTLTGGPSNLKQSFSLAQGSPWPDLRSHNSGPILPGSGYEIAETLPTSPFGNWTLASATCDNGSPVENITVGPGQTVTCTFVNTSPPIPEYPLGLPLFFLALAGIYVLIKRKIDGAYT